MVPNSTVFVIVVDPNYLPSPESRFQNHLLTFPATSNMIFLLIYKLVRGQNFSVVDFRDEVVVTFIVPQTL